MSGDGGSTHGAHVGCPRQIFTLFSMGKGPFVNCGAHTKQERTKTLVAEALANM